MKKTQYLGVILIVIFCCLEVKTKVFSYYSDAQEISENNSDLNWENNKAKNFIYGKFNSGGNEDCVVKDEEPVLKNDEIYSLVKDYPLEQALPYLEEYDNKVVAMVVGIAKKESDWGRHAPKKHGLDCYNYWGYKGSASRGSVLGYSCFGSPEEAIEKVASRISELAARGLNTPGKMIVWKCGSSCAGHSPESVKKWIKDVGQYYNLVAS